MSTDDDIQREEMRVRVAGLQAAAEAVRSVVEDEIDSIVEENDDLIAGRCECCAKVVFWGDRGHQYEDGPLSCHECAPTWSDAKDNWEADEDVDGRARFFERLEKHLAVGGTLEDRLDYVL